MLIHSIKSVVLAKATVIGYDMSKTEPVTITATVKRKGVEKRFFTSFLLEGFPV